MLKLFLFLYGIISALNINVSSPKPGVPKYGFFESSFTAAGTYENPYTDLTAEVEIRRPDGTASRIPLFWDGEKCWKLRLSPDMEGEWSYIVTSRDKGLNRKKGSFTCVSSSLKGSIGPMDEFQTHFQYQNRERMWFMGETAWALLTDNEQEKLDRKAFENFVETRVSQGFNVVHVMMLSEAGWGNTGGLPFLSMERQILNPRYWEEVDSRIRFANDHSLVVGLALAWGDKNRKVPFPWRLFPDTDARKHYARYIAARYSAYNVYFIISGEWHGEINTRPEPEEEVRKEFIDIGNVLDEADPHERMIGIHPMTAGGSVREFNQAAWMSFGDYQQNYSELHSRILESMVFSKPVVNSEYGYHLRDQNGDGVPDKDNSTSTESMRNASWDIVMAGGYLVTGFGTTYFGGNRDPGPFDTDAEKNDEWELQIGCIKKLFEGLEYWKLKSYDSLLACNIRRSNDGKELGRITPPASTYWLLAEPGRQYLIYVRGLSEKITLKLGNSSAGKYSMHLFNPRSGEIKSLNIIDITSKYEWLPPDKNDWVLLFQKQVNQGL